jgi:hypothetical protein
MRLQLHLMHKSSSVAAALHWQLAATARTMAPGTLSGSASTAAVWLPGFAGGPLTCAPLATTIPARGR